MASTNRVNLDKRKLQNLPRKNLLLLEINTTSSSILTAPDKTHLNHFKTCKQYKQGRFFKILLAGKKYVPRVQELYSD